MKTLNGIADLSTYFTNIEERLIHHGAHLRPLVGTLSTAFIGQLHPSAPIEVRTYNGKLTNQVKLTLRNGVPIKVTYHPGRNAISVINLRTRRILAKFTPADDLTDVAEKIRAWGKVPVIKLPSQRKAA